LNKGAGACYGSALGRGTREKGKRKVVKIAPQKEKREGVKEGKGSTSEPIASQEDVDGDCRSKKQPQRRRKKGKKTRRSQNNCKLSEVRRSREGKAIRIGKRARESVAWFISMVVAKENNQYHTIPKACQRVKDPKIHRPVNQKRKKALEGPEWSV